MFGKKEKNQQVKLQGQETPAAKPKKDNYDIKVMPVKFHKFLAPKKGGLLKLLIIFFVALIVVAGISFGAFYLFTNMNQSPPQPPEPVINKNAAPSNDNVNEVNQNDNTNESVNENVNINENANINENVNINANVNSNTNINVPVPATDNLGYFSSHDADNDQLTDIEEDIYQTEKRKPDTDADGFIDGQEIINGYNPKAAGASSLELSGLVNKYTNPKFNYEILHISTWLAKPSDQSLKEIIFQSATGEFVEVLIEDNPENLGLIEWYLTQQVGANISQLDKKTDKQGYEILVSPDKLTYFLLNNDDKERIYIISYMIGNKTSINFLTSFEMMINSFKLIKSSVESGE